MISHNMRASECPCCGYFLDAATPADNDNNHRPTPGDVSVCIDCGAMLYFNTELQLAVVPDKDSRRPEYDAARKVQLRVLEFNRIRTKT